MKKIFYFFLPVIFITSLFLIHITDTNSQSIKSDSIKNVLNNPIKLTGTKNTRDVGGYNSDLKKYRSVKKNRLIRSDSIEKLTAKDKEILFQEHHVKYIIDLRTSKQIDEKPDPIIDGVKYLQLSVLGEKSNYDNDDAGMYKDMLDSKSAKQSYHQFFKELANNPSETFLVHCSHGMDRTGVAVALFYTILGVKKEDIYKEYLISNKLLDVNWANTKLLDIFFEKVTENYGSTENYLHNGLNLSNEDLNNIRESSLEPK